MARFPCPTPTLCGVRWHYDEANCRTRIMLGAPRKEIPIPRAKPVSSGKVLVNNTKIEGDGSLQEMSEEVMRIRNERIADGRDPLGDGDLIMVDGEMQVDEGVYLRWGEELASVMAYGYTDAEDAATGLKGMISDWIKLGYSELGECWDKGEPSAQYLATICGFSHDDHLRIEESLGAEYDPDGTDKMVRHYLDVYDTLEAWGSSGLTPDEAHEIVTITGESVGYLVGKTSLGDIRRWHKEGWGRYEIVPLIESGISHEEAKEARQHGIESESEVRRYAQIRSTGIGFDWAVKLANRHEMRKRKRMLRNSDIEQLAELYQTGVPFEWAMDVIDNG